MHLDISGVKQNKNQYLAEESNGNDIDSSLAGPSAIVTRDLETREKSSAPNGISHLSLDILHILESHKVA